jgi:hypothetical protein
VRVGGGSGAWIAHERRNLSRIERRAAREIADESSGGPGASRSPDWWGSEGGVDSRPVEQIPRTGGHVAILVDPRAPRRRLGARRLAGGAAREPRLPNATFDAIRIHPHDAIFADGLEAGAFCRWSDWVAGASD